MERTSVLINTREAANRLGVTPRTIARMVERGVLEPKYRGSGRRGVFLFNARDIDQIAEQDQTPG
jgi:excisionase family DNA binding protein